MQVKLVESCLRRRRTFPLHDCAADQKLRSFPQPAFRSRAATLDIVHFQSDARNRKNIRARVPAQSPKTGTKRGVPLAQSDGIMRHDNMPVTCRPGTAADDRNIHSVNDRCRHFRRNRFEQKSCRAGIGHFGSKRDNFGGFVHGASLETVLAQQADALRPKPQMRDHRDTGVGQMTNQRQLTCRSLKFDGITARLFHHLTDVSHAPI